MHPNTDTTPDRQTTLDRAVANAATAWLKEPRDTIAYTHLVRAVECRNAWMNPPLPGTNPPGRPKGGGSVAGNNVADPETTDDEQATAGSAPVRVGDVFSVDPHDTLAKLRQDDL